MRIASFLIACCMACAGSSGGGEEDPTTDTDDETSTGDGTSGPDMGEVESCRLVSPPEITRFEAQPMVVDVRLRLEAAVSVELEHDTDPGVRVQLIDGGGGLDPEFRVRGLTPGIEHALTARGADGEPCGEVATALFEAHPPLTGFVADWEVSAGAGEPESVYRLFDLSNIPAAGITRVFAVDAEGTTRFFLGEDTQVTGPSAVRAGVKLREDGTLLYLFDDAIRVVDEFGQVSVEISAADLGVPGLHHDVIELDSGNFLTIAYTFRDIDYPGEGTLHVAGDVLVEVTPGGEVVWTWDSFDHLDPLRIRDGFDLLVPDPDAGEPGRDWTHANGVVEKDGLVLLSLRHQDWILAIDRESDELRWRLGPEGDFALGSGRWFFHQHSPQWQPGGELLLYDNGVGNPSLPDPQETSRAVSYALDLDAMTAEQAWEDDEAPFTAPVAGDADRMPGGHLLVLDSSIGGFANFHARLREIDPVADPMRVWSIESVKGTFMYRAVPSARLVGEASE